MKNTHCNRFRLLNLLLQFALVVLCTQFRCAAGQFRCSDRVDSKVPTDYCPFVFAEIDGEPRGLFIDKEGDRDIILVVDREKQRVVSLTYEDDEDGEITVDKREVLQTDEVGINHGIVVNGGWLYLSSSSEVWKWKYEEGNVSGERVLVVQGIPDDGHTTRTLVFYQGDLLVQVGSFDNVDRDPSRAMIRVVENGDGEELEWDDLPVFAEGLRNTVGLKVDTKGRLWGVENGRDELNVPGVGDVHQNNPCEELNLIQRER